jgi:RNA polymerase sigma-70 factor (ECF subfamily)
MTEPGTWHGSTNDPEDGVLVQRTLQGDARAFEALVHRYERLVFRVAGGFLRDQGEVEDVAQDAFLRAFGGLSGFRQEAPFGPWVARITTRLCYDRLRARRSRHEVAWEELGPAEQRAAQDLAAGADLERVAGSRDLAERALAALPPKDRQALILADALGCTAAEVAKALGCTALAARLRLHRARRAMQRVANRLLDAMGEAK